MSTYIAIALLAALLVGGGYTFWRVKRVTEDLSTTMFGVKSLKKGLEQQADLLAETPKSVSGMTKIFLPQIQKDFPEFNWAEFKVKAENLLKSSLAAVDGQDIARLEGASLDLKNQVRLQIEDLKARELEEHFNGVGIHRTEISHYVKRDGLCVITLQSAVEYYHYQESSHGEITGGVKDRKEQTKYDMELVYIQDMDKVGSSTTGTGVTCPQCGAPIKRLGSKFCEYCGTAIEVVNAHVWSLNKISKNV